MIKSMIRRIYYLYLTIIKRALVGKKIQVEPFIVVRKKNNNSIFIGKNTRINSGVRFYLDSEIAMIRIGENSFINRRSEICSMSSICIGNNVLIGWDVLITDTDYHSINDNKKSKSITIEDNCWIGSKAIILKGVHIHEGAVIAAGSVVTKDVAAYTLVAGNPAKIVQENILWKK